MSLDGFHELHICQREPRAHLALRPTKEGPHIYVFGLSVGVDFSYL